MAQQSAQLPHKEKAAGANPARAPIFSKRGRAAIATRCKRVVPPGYEGASPSASTILHPTRRKRRTVLVRQTAGRTSLWMLQFCGCGETVDAPARGAGGRKLMRVRFPLSAPIYRGVVKSGNTAASKPAGRECPCRCKSGRRDQSCGRAWNSRPGGLKNRCAAPARGRASRPGRTKFLSVSGGTYTRESQKLVGGSPCRCKSCLADQFRRVVQSEPSAL